MNNTINGRTPDEIKKGLNHCSEDGCKQCPYKYDCDMADGFSVLAGDALAYIHQLERERDAAVKQLQTASRPCNSCKYGDEIVENDTVCKECKIVMRNGDLYYDYWQWSGVQEVE